MVRIRQRASSRLTVWSPPETVLLTQATAWMAHESYLQHPICHLNYFHFHISMYFLMTQINSHLRQIACPWLPDPLQTSSRATQACLSERSHWNWSQSIMRLTLQIGLAQETKHLACMTGRQIIKIQARSWQLKWRTSVSGEHWRSPWWLCDVKQWFHWWNLKDCPCAARGQPLVLCLCSRVWVCVQPRVLY